MVTKQRSVKEGRIKVGFELTVEMQEGIIKVAKEEGYNDQAEFMRAAVREKIDGWKREHDAYGKPVRVKKEE